MNSVPIEEAAYITLDEIRRAYSTHNWWGLQ